MVIVWCPPDTGMAPEERWHYAHDTRIVADMTGSLEFVLLH